MSFGQFIAILRARWLAALVVLLVIVGATLTISLLMPRQYKATASVVVDFKPDPITAVMYGGMASPALMATQVDIIQSERVALRVVRNLKLNENPQVRAQWLAETGGEGSIESWLSGVFQRQMTVVPSRESSVISVSYLAPDPRFAAGLANAFVRAYIDTALELRVNPARQYSTFFDTRAKEARDALEAAQTRLSEFQRANGIIVTDERFDVENARLTELSSQLTALQAIAAESSSRDRQARGEQGERLQEVLNNAVVAQLKTEISRSEAQLQQLQTRLGDAHPQVQEVKANIAELRSRLQAETRRVTGSVGITNTINRSREAAVRAELEQQRLKVAKMKAVRDDGLVLIRDVENAQKAYDAIQQRYTQTSLESQTTQSNVNVLTEALPPIDPSTPRVLLNTLIALFIGTLLALGTALLLELRDRRVRAHDDVVVALGLPVIGTLLGPESRLRLSRRPSAMQQRLLAPLPGMAGPGRGA